MYRARRLLELGGGADDGDGHAATLADAVSRDGAAAATSSAGSNGFGITAVARPSYSVTSTVPLTSTTGMPARAQLVEQLVRGAARRDAGRGRRATAAPPRPPRAPRRRPAASRTAEAVELEVHPADHAQRRVVLDDAGSRLRAIHGAAIVLDRRPR